MKFFRKEKKRFESLRYIKLNWIELKSVIKISNISLNTNTIESLNSTYWKLNRQRSVFPSDTVFFKYTVNS